MVKHERSGAATARAATTSQQRPRRSCGDIDRCRARCREQARCAAGTHVAGRGRALVAAARTGALAWPARARRSQWHSNGMALRSAMPDRPGHTRLPQTRRQRIRAPELRRKLMAELSRAGPRRIGIIVSAAARRRRPPGAKRCSRPPGPQAWRCRISAAVQPSAGACRASSCTSTPARLARIAASARAGNLVRTLTALPPNKLDVSGYRRLLRELARRHGLQVALVFGNRSCSASAPVLFSRSRAPTPRAHRRHRASALAGPAAANARAPDVALVGKGILFDTGGINLKPHRSMLDMHTDMSGSAVALASSGALRS